MTTRVFNNTRAWSGSGTSNGDAAGNVGSVGSVLSHFAELQRESAYTDVVLVCADGTVSECHQAVLDAASPFLRGLFKSFNRGRANNCCKAKISFCLPDFSSDAVKQLMQFIYVGFVRFKSREEKEEVKALMTALGILGGNNASKTTAVPAPTTITLPKKMTIVAAADRPSKAPRMLLPMPQPMQTTPSFSCLKCSRKFTTKSGIEAHMAECYGKGTITAVGGFQRPSVPSQISKAISVIPASQAIGIQLPLSQVANNPRLTFIQAKTITPPALLPGTSSRPTPRVFIAPRSSLASAESFDDAPVSPPTAGDAQVVDQGISDKSFPCPMCPKMFFESENLQYHIEHYHSHASLLPANGEEEDEEEVIAVVAEEGDEEQEQDTQENENANEDNEDEVQEVEVGEIAVKKVEPDVTEEEDAKQKEQQEQPQGSQTPEPEVQDEFAVEVQPSASSFNSSAAVSTLENESDVDVIGDADGNEGMVCMPDMAHLLDTSGGGADNEIEILSPKKKRDSSVGDVCPLCNKFVAKNRKREHLATSHFNKQLLAFVGDDGGCLICGKNDNLDRKMIARHAGLKHNKIMDLMDEKTKQFLEGTGLNHRGTDVPFCNPPRMPLPPTITSAMPLLPPLAGLPLPPLPSRIPFPPPPAGMPLPPHLARMPVSSGLPPPPVSMMPRTIIPCPSVLPRPSIPSGAPPIPCPSVMPPQPNDSGAPPIPSPSVMPPSPIPVRLPPPATSASELPLLPGFPGPGN